MTSLERVREKFTRLRDVSRTSTTYTCLEVRAEDQKRC